MKYRERNARTQQHIKWFSCTLLGLKHPRQASLSRVQISGINQSLL